MPPAAAANCWPTVPVRDAVKTGAPAKFAVMLGYKMPSVDGGMYVLHVDLQTQNKKVIDSNVSVRWHGRPQGFSQKLHNFHCSFTLLQMLETTDSV